MAVFISEPLPDFTFYPVFGSVYFGIVPHRRRPPISKNPLKKWQHLTGITGSLSSEWVAGFASDYPFVTFSKVPNFGKVKIAQANKFIAHINKRRIIEKNRNFRFFYKYTRVRYTIILNLYMIHTFLFEESYVRSIFNSIIYCSMVVASTSEKKLEHCKCVNNVIFLINYVTLPGVDVLNFVVLYLFLF